MKSIAMITYPDIADGKGRFLQAYALYSFIKSLGFDVEIIDYVGIVQENKVQRFLRHLGMLSVKNIKEYFYIRKERHIMQAISTERRRQRKTYEDFIYKNE